MKKGERVTIAGTGETGEWRQNSAGMWYVLLDGRIESVETAVRIHADRVELDSEKGSTFEDLRLALSDPAVHTVVSRGHFRGESLVVSGGKTWIGDGTYLELERAPVYVTGGSMIRFYNASIQFDRTPENAEQPGISLCPCAYGECDECQLARGETPEGRKSSEAYGGFKLGRCECGSGSHARGPGHSNWCKLYEP